MFGVLLDKKQLEKYMEKLACDHNLKPESEEKTYPIPALEKDFKYISMVYNLLNEHIKIGIDIHPVGEALQKDDAAGAGSQEGERKKLPFKTKSAVSAGSERCKEYDIRKQEI